MGSKKMTWCTRIAVLAASYAALCYLGGFFALPTTGASPTWPAAGLAFGALIVWGPSLWPGVWCGAFLYFALALYSPAGGVGWGTGCIIATAATLQALLGWRLTRARLARPLPLTSFTDIIRFLLYAGPVACLVSATLVVPMQPAAHSPDMPLWGHWLTWWIGDSTGVLMLAPVFVLLLPPFESTRGRLAALVALPLLVAGGLLVAAEVFFHVAKDLDLRTRLRERGRSLAVETGQRFTSVNETLQDVERLFAASGAVSRHEFADFAAPSTRRAGLAVVAWLPRVAAADRGAFESAVRREGLKGFRITEQDRYGNLVPATPRAEYFPILYAEPFRPDRIELGFNATSEAYRRWALERSRDTAETVATPPVRLLTSEAGMITFVPVYRKGFHAETASREARRAALVGYIYGALSTKQLFAPLVENARREGLLVRISDVTSGRPVELLSFPPSEMLGGLPQATRELDFNGRRLRLELFPTIAVWGDKDGAEGRILSLSSLVGIFLVALASLGAAMRQAATSAEVRERTAELSEELAAHRATAGALRESEARLRDIIDNMAVFVGEMTPDGVLTNTNRAALMGRAVDRDLVTGKPLDKTLWFSHSPEVQDRVREAIERAQRGEVVRFDINARLADGTITPLDFMLAPVYDEAERLIKLIPSAIDITERHSAEIKLRASEAFSRSVVESTPDCLRVLSLDGRVLYMAPLGRQIMEVDDFAAIEGMDWLSRWHEEDQPMAREIFRQAVAGTQGRFVGRMPTLKGTEKWWDVMVTAIPGPDGATEKLLSVSRDITRQKRLEERLWQLKGELERRVEERTAALREQQALDSVLLENLAEGVVVCDAGGRVTLLNGMARRWSGLGKDDDPAEQPYSSYGLLEADGKTPMEPARSPLQRALRGEQVRNAELCIQHHEGPIHCVLASGGPIYDADGELKGAMIAIHDITGIKESQQRFQNLFEFASDAIVILDEEGRIIQANLQTEALFGWKSDEVIGQRVEILVQEQVRPRLAALLDRHDSRPWPREVGGAQVRGLRKNGSTFAIEMTLNPLVSGERSSLLVAAARDVTERRRQQDDRLARAVAEKANHAKTSFLAAMSHEIRTPMNAVLGLAEVLAYSDLSPRQAELVTTMRESAGLLLHLIDDILDISKIEAGRFELERAPVDIRELVERAAAPLASLARQKDTELRLFVSPRLPARILGDEMRLRQVIYNLVGNAIKFSGGREGRRGMVELRAEVHQEEPLILSLTVIDNGIGMGPEVMANLFKPFTQGDSATTRRYGGTGLGLAICKKIVELAGGEIGVTSSRDEGSRFDVLLKADAVGGPPENHHPLAGIRCRLLEGESYCADDLQLYLEHAGALVSRAVPAEGAGGSRPGDGLVLIGDGGSLAAASPPEGTGQVMIGADQADLRGGAVGVDCAPLTYSALIRAVALAAGREMAAADGLEATSLAADPDGAAAVRDTNLRILVAEDDPVNQKVIIQQLCLLGYAADVAGSGMEALRLWQEKKHPLLITDLNMPQMDGYALARAIRAAEKKEAAAGMQAPRLPIVVLTANVLRGERVRARNAGIDDYLTKPASLKDLRAALERWLTAPTGAAQDAPSEPKVAAKRGGLVDLAALKKLVGDSEEMVRDLLAEYVISSASMAAEMREAAAREDSAAIAAMAHRLKSSSRSIGAFALGDICARLEKAGTGGDLTAIVEQLSVLEAMHSNVLKELTGILEGGTYDC